MCEIRSRGKSDQDAKVSLRVTTMVRYAKKAVFSFFSEAGQLRAFCLVSRHPFLDAFGKLLLLLRDGKEASSDSLCQASNGLVSASDGHPFCEALAGQSDEAQKLDSGTCINCRSALSLSFSPATLWEHSDIVTEV